MRDGVDAAGETGHHGHAMHGEATRELVGGFAAIGGGSPRADDRDGPLVLRLPGAAYVDDGRRVVDLAEAGRVGRVRTMQRADAGLREALALGAHIDLRSAAHDLLGGASVETGGYELLGPGEPGLLHGVEGGFEEREARRAEAADAVQADPVGKLICSYVVHGHKRSRRWQEGKCSPPVEAARSVRPRPPRLPHSGSISARGGCVGPARTAPGAPARVRRFRPGLPA